MTTPQEVALLDSRKSINFAKTISVPVLGVVENMSGYTIRGESEPNSKISIMGPGGCQLSANQIMTEGGKSLWMSSSQVEEKNHPENGGSFPRFPPFRSGIVREEMMECIESSQSRREKQPRHSNR